MEEPMDELKAMSCYNVLKGLMTELGTVKDLPTFNEFKEIYKEEREFFEQEQSLQREDKNDVNF